MKRRLILAEYMVASAAAQLQDDDPGECEFTAEQVRQFDEGRRHILTEKLGGVTSWGALGMLRERDDFWQHAETSASSA